MDTRSVLIALNVQPRLQRAALCRLAGEPDSWNTLPAASASAAAELGVPLQHLETALHVLPQASRLADEECRQAERLGCRLLTRGEPAYPPALLDHPLPPPVLYCRGELTSAPAVAVVGSRRMDAYGKEVTELFAGELARSGVVVVSGFALGVDQTAHRAAIEAGGRTLAVLGCGIDVGYPARSQRLADAIAQNGAVLTEFPLGCEPRAWHFPIRNRVIAALSAATLVAQAKERSGSLITAHLALELGREVFAVPGRIFDELSAGSNGLLADGACLVSSPRDVLEHLALGWQRELFPIPEATPKARSGPAAPRPDGFIGRVLDLVIPGAAGRNADDLASELDASVDRVLGALLELELAGWVERSPGPLYRR